MNEASGIPDIQMDPEALYREDVFTDNQVGSIRRLTPVTADGSVDDNRAVMYVGSTQIMTPAGALPITFEIEAVTLGEAATGFGPAAQQAVQQTMEELRHMQRETASQIVVPRGGVDPSGMGGPGGSKIQIP